MNEKFKNISAINANISRLYKSITVPLVPDFATNQVLDGRYYHSNVVIYTQNIARQIANHYGLQITKIVVTFIHNLGIPGKVELSAGNTFFVEVDEKYKSNTNFISAILAHEIAHIYLFKHTISISDTLQNEILTDTTAAFLGCAWLILNSSYEEASELNKTINSFGYPCIAPAVAINCSVILNGLEKCKFTALVHASTSSARTDFQQPALLNSDHPEPVEGRTGFYRRIRTNQVSKCVPCT